MLTLKRIKQNSQAVVEALARKGVEAREAIAQVVDLDQARRALQAEADTLQANINQASKEIGSLMRQGQQQAAEQLKTNVAAFKEKVKAATERMGQIDRELSDILVQLPNLPHESVPDGRTADDNLVVRTEGELPEPSSSRLPHWEVASRLGIINFELGVKITGSGFPLYLGAGAKLERSLINFFLEENAKAGYQEVMPPIMVNADSAYATGQLPDKEGQMYHVPQDGFYLVPTAEVPLTNIYRDAILEERELPVRITAYTPCFRREAGSYGKDVRGLNRLHQFDKVEIVCIETPERSYDRLEEMVQHVELLLQKLELPYRVLKLCAGDMSFTSALTYDLEVYSAGQDRWLEVSSVSNFEDYQANRLQLRYRSEAEKRNALAHTLNGSSLALPRVVAALLENHQTPHGVRIPKALQPWMGVEELRWK
ncbi:MAG: serine--tRNA ligase [Bacteroidia bacterium]|jgi:serine--tRNA ligase|nr:serine--tRNA ligase [Bacteroidia bacterium]